MKTEKPRDDLADLIGAVEYLLDDPPLKAKGLEILRSAPRNDQLTVLLRWITEYRPTYKDIVAWAAEQCLRLPASKKAGRAWRLKDIENLIETPPEGWSPELIRFFRRCYWTERREVNRGYRV